MEYYKIPNNSREGNRGQKKKMKEKQNGRINLIMSTIIRLGAEKTCCTQTHRQPASNKNIENMKNEKTIHQTLIKSDSINIKQNRL